MRTMMRIAGQFESWACMHINFDELTDVWAYLLEDRFGEACLAFLPLETLTKFDESDCLRVAMRLRLPVIVDGKLPIPVDVIATNPVTESAFREFRIQTVRDSIEGGDTIPYLADDEPFDEKFGQPYFGLYGVADGGTLEHIADRKSYSEALSLAQKIAPGAVFSVVHTGEGTEGAVKGDKKETNLRSGFCIYIDTLCQGPVPVVSDEHGYIVFATDLEAQKEIADHQITRLQQFLAGERNFEDAITAEEYVVPVSVHPDGTIVDADGNCFSPKPD